MVAIVKTLAFSGVNTIDVNVEVKISTGMVAFNIVGLPDKSVNEAKERVRAAINSMGLAFPARRVTVNLTPADLSKEGGYLDLPIVLGLLIEMGIIPQDAVDGYIVMGELSLDSRINPVSGILPSAIRAGEKHLGLICPASCGSEALWAGEYLDILAPENLIALVSHFKGNQILRRPELMENNEEVIYPDFKDVVGQEQVKRSLEIAAAGGHNLLMIGPAGTGKSMMAQRLPGILPDLTAKEILEVNVIASVAGLINNGKLITKRPFLDPHHSCSMPAMVGGGMKPRPGQISLAHKGVLFLDELPEFQRQVLDSLRQPLETKYVTVARANSHVTYPADFQLIAAMNPCRCGHLMDEKKQCKRAPICAEEYQSKISGPLIDRIDIYVEVPRINIFETKRNSKESESSKSIKERVIIARKIQEERYKNTENKSLLNCNASGKLIEKFANLSYENEEILRTACEKFDLSMRSYIKILRVSRTIADLKRRKDVEKDDILEALRYRKAKTLRE